MADFDRESMMEMFTFEMSHLLEQLEQTVIQGEVGFAMDDINEIFRIMHTIKGSAAMMMFENISSTAHAIEDVFYYLREENPRNIDFSSLTDLVLEAMDFIKTELGKIESNLTPDGDGKPIIEKIKKFLAVLKGEIAPPQTSTPEENKAPTSTAEPNEAASSVEDLGFIPESLDEYNAMEPDENGEPVFSEAYGEPVEQQKDHVGNIYHYEATVFFEKGSEMENIRAYALLYHLENKIFNVQHTPEDIIDESASETIVANGFRFSCDSYLEYSQLREILLETIYLAKLELEELGSQAIGPMKQYIATIFFEDGSEMENVRCLTVIHHLKGKARVLTHTPQDIISEESVDYIRSHGFTMQLETEKTYDELYELLSYTIYLKELTLKECSPDEMIAAEESYDELIGDLTVDRLFSDDIFETTEEPVEESKFTPVPEKEPVEPVKFTTSANTAVTYSTTPSPAIQEKQEGTTVKKTTTQHVISVNVSKLDQLLNLMGELVIAEAMVTQNPELDNLELENFHKEARQLRKIINDVQDTVMSMRMVPLSTTFFKMHRIVRDMCKQLDKEVNLEIVGEDTEVDKNIIEHISDPLMHIIRNSIDHGIETAKERARKGKPEKGTVLLEAKNSGGDVLIIVRDDGAGLDKDKIMEKAKKNGLLKKPEGEYTDKEIHQFIFIPGFSTNDTVTNFSGRGVGMDVVSNNLEVVGGSILVDSVPGEGSAFTMKIPLTLAIIEGMTIKMGGSKYTIPIIHIKQSFKATKDDLFSDPNGNEMITVRGEVYNVVRLYEFFNVASDVTDVEEGIIIMLENGDQTVCVMADELIGEQQVVVKTMPKYIRKIRGISGCTLLGNGDISLIIDVAGFFDK